MVQCVNKLLPVIWIYSVRVVFSNLGFIPREDENIHTTYNRKLLYFNNEILLNLFVKQFNNK